MDAVTTHELELPSRQLTLARRVLGVLEREWLVAVVCAFVVVRITAADQYFLGSDSWFSFVYGREILHHGLPHHDTLTVMGGGRAWLDQQWLGHLALYGLVALGGPKLAVLASVALFSLAFIGAIVLARRRGGSRAALAASVFPALYYSTSVVQTEVFSRVFFLVALVLLAAESRRPSRRVWLAFPLLVLWANVHGAVVLGASLVALLGVVELGRWACGRSRSALRAGALVGLPWLCVFATPYGLAIAGYYRSTVFNSAFHRYIDVWQRPSPFHLEADWPFFALLPVAAYIALRHHRRLEPYEQAVLGLTLLGALEARRSIPWFVAACVLFLPVACRRERDARPGRSSALVRLAAAAFAILFAGLGVAQAAVAPQAHFTRYFYDERAAAYVARYAERHPRATIWANDPFGDWLVFVEPPLWGRVAYDARWENLSAAQIRDLHRFLLRVGPDWARPVYRYDLVLISQRTRRKLRDALANDPRLRLAFRDRRVLIYATGTQAGDRR